MKMTACCVKTIEILDFLILSEIGYNIVSLFWQVFMFFSNLLK